ncbi:vacuolar ATPase assembly integral membrane protein vma21 [Stygiomarasmius scandens]|uniref:Vacuolar ATPase assembly integral membrane protein vma21 n=1 Tax=Marasmiellus scandens TaxID=2682957 RepID=A0ABR1K7A6_9AGAR
MAEQVAASKVNTELAQQGTLVKLIIFSLSLGIVPLTAYFASLNYVWNGNATFAALTAVMAANVVLVAYIITSVYEDKRPREAGQGSESKKER